MVPDWNTLVTAFNAALHGMAPLWVICGALVLTTLLLEDLAIAAGVALAVQGAISWELAFAAVAGGIALGDVGLYGLGLAAHRVPLLHRKYILGDGQQGRQSRGAWARGQLQQRLPSAVLLARVIPGLRLVTYTACGFLRLPFWPFAGWVLLAVSLWTAGLFWFSTVLGDVLSTSLHIPLPLAVALPIIALALALPLLRFLKQRFYTRPL